MESQDPRMWEVAPGGTTQAASWTCQLVLQSLFVLKRPKTFAKKTWMYNCTLMDKLKQKLNCHVYFQGCLVGRFRFLQETTSHAEKASSIKCFSRHYTLSMLSIIRSLTGKLNLYSTCN